MEKKKTKKLKTISFIIKIIFQSDHFSIVYMCRQQMNEQPDFLVPLVMMYSVLIERFDISHKNVNLFEEKRYEYHTD